MASESPFSVDESHVRSARYLWIGRTYRTSVFGTSSHARAILAICGVARHWQYCITLGRSCACNGDQTWRGRGAALSALPYRSVVSMKWVGLCGAADIVVQLHIRYSGRRPPQACRRLLRAVAARIRCCCSSAPRLRRARRTGGIGDCQRRHIFSGGRVAALDTRRCIATLRSAHRHISKGRPPCPTNAE